MLGKITFTECLLGLMMVLGASHSVDTIPEKITRHSEIKLLILGQVPWRQGFSRFAVHGAYGGNAFQRNQKLEMRWRKQEWERDEERKFLAFV